MNAMTKFVRLFFLAILFVFTACSPEDGAQGPPGQDGIDGIDGVDGNANVIASAWIATSFSTTASTISFFDISDSNITAEILDSGVILAYGKINNASARTSIPYVIRNNSYFIYTFVGTIRFLGATVDGSSEIFNNVSEVRYVIIPSNNTARNVYVDYTQMTYEEVMDHFGLDY